MEMEDAFLDCSTLHSETSFGSDNSETAKSSPSPCSSVGLDDSLPELTTDDLFENLLYPDFMANNQKEQKQQHGQATRLLPTMVLPFPKNPPPVQVQGTSPCIVTPAQQGPVQPLSGINEISRQGDEKIELRGSPVVMSSPPSVVSKEAMIPTFGTPDGQNEVKTKRSAIPVKTSGTKKLKMYERDETKDPKVKNAKSAKANRDKKKQLFEDMQTEIDTLKQTVSFLTTSLSAMTEDRDKHKNLREQDRQARNMSVGIQRNFTNVKKILEAVIPSLTMQFGPMKVQIPDSFAKIPARLLDDGTVETFGGGGNRQGGTHSSKATSTKSDLSTSATIHINPEKGTIQVDYNPDLH